MAKIGYNMGVPSFRQLSPSPLVQFSVPDMASAQGLSGLSDSSSKGKKASEFPEGLRSHLMAYANLQNATIMARQMISSKIREDIEKAGSYENYIRNPESGHQENMQALVELQKSETNLKVLEKVMPFYKENWSSYQADIEAKGSGDKYIMDENMRPVPKPGGGYYTYNQYLRAIDDGTIGVSPMGGHSPSMFTVYDPIQEGAAEDYFKSILIPAANHYNSISRESYGKDWKVANDGSVSGQLGYYFKVATDKTSNKNQIASAVEHILTSMPQDAIKELRSDYLANGLGDAGDPDGFQKYVMVRLGTLANALTGETDKHSVTKGLDLYGEAEAAQRSYFELIGDTAFVAANATHAEKMNWFEAAVDENGKPMYQDGRPLYEGKSQPSPVTNMDETHRQAFSNALTGHTGVSLDPGVTRSLYEITPSGFIAGNGSIITNPAHLKNIHLSHITGRVITGPSFAVDPNSGRMVKYAQRMPDGSYDQRSYLEGIAIFNDAEADAYMENTGNRKRGDTEWLDPDRGTVRIGNKTYVSPDFNITNWNPFGSNIKDDRSAVKNSGMWRIKKGVWGVKVYIPYAGGQGYTMGPSKYNTQRYSDLVNYAQQAEVNYQRMFGANIAAYDLSSRGMY